MLNEKIRRLRKEKGVTQEELAIRLNVVRQTVSKWEKGLSVPDANMLIKIGEYFEVATSELLGANYGEVRSETQQNAIAEQLSRMNEHLAIKNRRSRLIWKVVLSIVVGIILLNIVLLIVGMISFNSFKDGKGVEVQTQNEEVLISN